MPQFITIYVLQAFLFRHNPLFYVIYDKRKVKHREINAYRKNCFDWYSWKFSHFNLMHKVKGIFFKGGGVINPSTPPLQAIIRVDSETRNFTSDLAFVPVWRKVSFLPLKASHSLVVKISKRILKIWEYKEDIWKNFISVYY